MIHRIASVRTVKGAASFCVNRAFEQTGNIRTDMYENDFPMRNMLKKNRFRYCGIIHLENGNPRIVFQRETQVGKG